MRQTILLVDDDALITEALSMALEQPGRTVIVCSDVESAELALDRYPVTDLVTDVQFSGLFGYEGLHLVQRIGTKAAPCRMVLMTGRGTEDLRQAAFSAGATAVLNKPFDVAELESVLAPSIPGPGDFELIRIPSIEEILGGGDLLDIAFQPIVTLGGNEPTPFAYEALARIRGGWAGGGPGELFAYAELRLRSADLNRAAAIRAIESFAAVDPEALLFINVDPHTFHDQRLVETVIAAADRGGLALERIVLEITERTALIDDGITRSVLEQLRARGVRFALDDHGSAYSHLAAISVIQPSFVKISQTFGTDMERDADKHRVVQHVVALAHAFCCAVVLEGIESSATAAAAADLGVELAQGYFFSRPRERSHWTGAAA